MSSEKLYVPDCVFPSDNDLEIPTLRTDMQAKACNIPFICFGEQKRTFDMNGAGTLHFYTEDYRFDAVYEHPERILKHNPCNIVEPNFSIFNDMPVAFAMQAVYKKRFIARAMQEQGIRVFVDLNVASKYYKLNMIGVPLEWKAFCTRGYSNRLHYLDFEYRIAQEWAQGSDILFVVYGGGKLVREFCKTHHCIYINNVVTMKRKNRIKEIEQTVAFLSEDFSLKKQLPKATNFFDGQIEDYRKVIL